MRITTESQEECSIQYTLHHDVDERTSLLAKTSSQVSNPAASCESGKSAPIDEQNSKRKFLGIATSVFMGTFCAGLGEFGSQVMRLF